MDDQLSLEVCRQLKKELKRKHITYRGLSTRLNISEVSIKRLLNNQQPLSMQRLIAICNIIEMPLSKLLEEAENNLFNIPLFTTEQDQAFWDCPALFTFWTKLTEHQSVEQIASNYQLDQASVHRYLRRLEKVGLIVLGLNNGIKLCVPTHTAFEKGSKFPEFFTRQVLTRLQERVINIPATDQDAFLITLKAELTDEEFQEVIHKLDDWLFNLLRESQDLRSREGLAVTPFTFGFMAAKGAFHDELPAILPLQNRAPLTDK
ncbi:helix-turn-helix domain-containing protein [Photobacterium lutimaris]|uniref:XRE family transcriptional regulator n=1 Tax=Photobacterium lutimaris TaxID=388278 RepID=A0A2T3IXZ0_9GAMM|nr:helix-turn-helix transcriptional regulator [Photobacterium lutimaris]PSU33405.1 XRE family transcriptional regulator [Photobacterium lutimaris]TDR74995.1 Cro/C1-type helix-turn-helix DNA-binding protein [Photobacterium lutimaris]